MSTQGKRWAKHTARIDVPVQPDLKRDFENLTNSMGISVSDHIRMLMERALHNNRKKGKALGEPKTIEEGIGDGEA